MTTTSERTAKWRATEHGKAHVKAYYQKTKSVHKARSQKWVEENREEFREYQKQWRLANRDRQRPKEAAYARARRAKDPNARLKHALRSRINSALRPKGRRPGSAVKDLGCTISELRAHLESKFQPGMSWDNYGKYWVVDHIIPLANYDLTDREVFCRLCHFSNLQPLTRHDNAVKSNKE